MPLPIVDTRHAFRPASRDIVGVLRAATADDWERPTLAGSWRVRDVVAHMIDTALRRLSLQRDGALPGGLGPQPDQDFVAFINDLNATWTHAARRLSPRVLTDLYERASADLADFMASLDLEAAAFFPVSWAGESESRQWLDVGREFTEVWHHGAQIRDAVGAGPFPEPAWLRSVLQIAMHALPHAYRHVGGGPDDSIAIRVTGRSGGAWTLRRHGGAWHIAEGDAADPATVLIMTDEVAWRLFFNALSPADVESRVRVEGNADLARYALRTRAVIV
jgi:uncharacterized protein (TIGR03083 family)